MGCSLLRGLCRQLPDPALQVPCDGNPAALALGQARIPNRSAEDHLDPSEARKGHALPATFVRAPDECREDRQLVLQCEQAHPCFEGAQVAIGRARALWKQNDVASLANRFTAAGNRLPVEPVPVHGHRVAQEEGYLPLQRVGAEIVVRAQASDAVDPSEGKCRKQRQGIEVATVIGHDQVPPQPPQLSIVVQPEAVEQPQVRPQRHVNRDSDGIGNEVVSGQVERRRRPTVIPVHHLRSMWRFTRHTGTWSRGSTWGQSGSGCHSGRGCRRVPVSHCPCP